MWVKLDKKRENSNIKVNEIPVEAWRAMGGTTVEWLVVVFMEIIDRANTK